MVESNGKAGVSDAPLKKQKRRGEPFLARRA